MGKRHLNLSPIEQIDLLLENGHSQRLVPFVTGEHAPNVRAHALRALIRLKDPAALIACQKILAGENEDLASPLLDGLSDIEGNESLLAMANGISSPSMFIRAKTIQTIAMRPEPSAFAYLIRACRDKTGTVRDLGRKMLIRRAHAFPEQLSDMREETLEGVIEELPLRQVWHFLPGHTDPKVRLAAIRRMAHFDNEHVINFLVSTCIAGEPPFCDAAIEAIRQNQAVDAEHIRQILDWGPDFLHGRAFTCFAQRAGRKGVEYLNEGLESGNPQVREAAVRSLFRLFGVQIVPILTPMLSDSCDDVCLAVLDAVKEAPRQLVEESLLAAAGSQRQAVRERALVLAAAKGMCTTQLMQGYFALLDKKLKNLHPTGEDLDIICDIMHALKNAHTNYLLVYLIQGATSASPRLRRRSMEVLAEYETEYRLAAYAYIADSPDMHIVTTIAFALAEAHRPEAMVPLIRVAMGRKKKDARRARAYLSEMDEIRNIEKICELVKSPHGVVKQFAINRLKEMGDPAAVALLLQAMEEGNEELQRQALERLVELGSCEAEDMAEKGGASEQDRKRLEEMKGEADPRAIDMLLQAVEDEDEAVQYAAVEALGKYISEERVQKRMIELLSYGSVPVRQLAVQTLGENKVEDAVDPLIAALGNIFLRSYAEEALRTIGSRRGYLAMVRRRKREKMFPSRAKLERQKRMERYSAKRSKSKT